MPPTFIWLENKVTFSLHLQLQAAVQTGFTVYLGVTPPRLPSLSSTFHSYNYSSVHTLTYSVLVNSWGFLFLRVPKAGTSPEEQMIKKMGASAMPQRSPHVEQNENAI